jgi:putative hemolysin
MHALGRLPAVHDVLRIDGARITVLSMEGKRAGRLLISSDQLSTSQTMER